MNGRVPARYALALPGVAVVTGALVRALMLTNEGDPALGALVQANLAGSGASHAVTAVLLNFRGYDTWLELVVLLVAATATLRARGDRGEQRMREPGELVASGLAARMVPVVLLLGVLLLANGTSGPGGAFQAGAVFAAGALLMYFGGYRLVLVSGGVVQDLLLIVGTFGFFAAAVATTAAGMRTLEFAPRFAGPAIVGIELAATVSIAATLLLIVLAAEEESRASDP